MEQPDSLLTRSFKMSPDSTTTTTSPSSPRKRQFGFVPIRELKVESMEQDGMEDIWAELGGE